MIAVGSRPAFAVEAGPCMRTGGLGASFVLESARLSAELLALACLSGRPTSLTTDPECACLLRRGDLFF